MSAQDYVNVVVAVCVLAAAVPVLPLVLAHAAAGRR